MNRNTKRYPKEEINRLKKSGKRLRGGYVLTRLKNWKKRKATAKRVSVDLPATEIAPPKKSIKRPLERFKRGIKKRQRSKIARERLMYWKGGKKEEPKSEVKKTGKIVDIVKKDNKIDVLPKSKIEKIERVLPERKERAKKVTAPRPKKETISKVKKTGKIVDIVKKDNQPDVLPESKIEKIERVLPEKKERAKKNDLIVETIKKADNISESSKAVINAGSNTELIEYLKKFFNDSTLKNEMSIILMMLQKELKDKTVNWYKFFSMIDNFNSKGAIKKEKLSTERMDYIFEYLLTTSKTIWYEDFHKTAFDAIDVSVNILKYIKGKYSSEYTNTMPKSFVTDTIDKSRLVNAQKNLTIKQFDRFAKTVLENTDNIDYQCLYYDNKNVIITDGYTLSIIPFLYVPYEITRKLEDKKAYSYGRKKVKDLTHVKDANYPNYQVVIPKNKELVALLDVEAEITKGNQFKHWYNYKSSAYDNTIVKISSQRVYDYGEWFAYNYLYYHNIMLAFKDLGKKTVKMWRIPFEEYNAVTNNKQHMFTADDITMILAPVFLPKETVEMLEIGFDTKLYNFRDGTKNNNMIVPFWRNENVYQKDKTALSDNSYQTALFDDLNPNVNAGEEIKAIASDVPAFGDDIREEELELDSKLDLPEIKQERNSMEIASSKDIRTMRFKAMTLPSKYRQLLGKVPSNFRLLLWGAPGHGKSSLALTIANDIGKYVKTLYVSAEESLQSATLASRIKRFKANARNLMFNDTNNPEIIEKIILTQNPKFIVIDSVNVMIGKTEAMINLMLKYPDIGFILIAQATKDRKRYAGLGSLAHAVDIVVNVKSGVATAEKNRYSQLGSMPVKGIKI